MIHITPAINVKNFLECGRINIYTKKYLAPWNLQVNRNSVESRNKTSGNLKRATSDQAGNISTIVRQIKKDLNVALWNDCFFDEGAVASLYLPESLYNIS